VTDHLMSDPLVQALFRIEGMKYLRKLPTGEWVGLRDFMFTTGLLVGVDMTGYRTRYCYAKEDDALQALLLWDGTGDPEGPWIKEKGRGLDGSFRDRTNPKEEA
jgi:hypothetical protein